MTTRQRQQQLPKAGRRELLLGGGGGAGHHQHRQYDEVRWFGSSYSGGGDDNDDVDDDVTSEDGPSFDAGSGSGYQEAGFNHKWNKFPDGKRFWKPVPNSSRRQRPIFVAATRQHVGKTTCSLAIMSGLQKRYDKVGFLKPVGQQHVEVQCQGGESTIRVDKDCVLVREHFHLDHIDYGDMSVSSRTYTGVTWIRLGVQQRQNSCVCSQHLPCVWYETLT